MATSRLERELARRKKRPVAEPPAPGVPPVPIMQTLQELRGGLPSAPAPGMLPNRPPAPVPELPAPGVPTPINLPFQNRAPEPAPAQAQAPASAPIAPLP